MAGLTFTIKKRRTSSSPSTSRGRALARVTPSSRSRSVTPKSRSVARLPKPARKAAKPKTQGSQMGYKSATLSLAKPMSRGAMTSALTQSMLESMIYRWNGVKAFTGNGTFWMQNRVEVAGYRSLPFYAMDLTAVIQQQTSASAVAEPNVMVQLGQASIGGNMVFRRVIGSDAAGNAGSTATWIVEKAPVPPGTNTYALGPFGKTMIHHASISANLWGATAKATKYMVQVVRFLDDDLCPTGHEGLGTFALDVPNATARRNDFYQNLIKSWTFNPIATTGGLQASKYKVLKTQTITIEPNPTTDGDADPQCVVYKAFLKLNKICKYEETSQFIGTDVDLNDQADFALNVGSQVTTQCNKKQRIYLIIRATNYGSDAGDTNVNTPSFDLSVRVKHTVPK
ncbi:MAG: capsid protein [Cressdnaviricota sp.]|nr:MAG: capsid protein [Cressdnaviricota sp.]